ncbi:MAG: FISUMP domain-containing protein [Bacteroidia bacterium]
MKTKFLTISGIALLAISLTSCKKSSTSSNTTTTNTTTTTPTVVVGVGTCGTQTWDSLNLVLTPVSSYSVSANSNNPQPTGKEWCYNDIANNCTTYGAFFDWNNATGLKAGSGSGASSTCNPCGTGGIQGLCPTGYHIPTDLEWSEYEYCIEDNIAPKGTTTFTTFSTTSGFRGSSTAGVGPGSKLKTATGNPWGDGSYSTNTSGFGALPAGAVTAGSWAGLGTEIYYWTATESSSGSAYYRFIYQNFATSNRNSEGEVSGASVRCLKD